MCTVNAEYLFLCVFCLWLSRVWEAGQSHSASVSASLSTSLKHLMLTKGSCLPSLERDSSMKRTLFMSGAVRIMKLTDGIKSARSALRAPVKRALGRYASHYLFLSAGGVRDHISICSKSFYFSCTVSLFSFTPPKMYFQGFFWYMLLFVLSDHCSPPARSKLILAELN